MPELLVATRESADNALTVPDMRRAQFVEAATRLFSQRGYFNTSIEDIAKAVPVSKGLFYRYFRDKNDLLFYCLSYLFDRYKHEHVPRIIAQSGPLKFLIELIEMHCTHSQEHILEVTLAYKSMSDLTSEQRSKIKILESKTARMFRQCIDACIGNGIMSQVNSDILAYQYIMFSHSWALKNWAFRDLCSFDEYLNECHKLLLVPLLTAKGLEEYAALDRRLSRPRRAADQGGTDPRSVIPSPR